MTGFHNGAFDEGTQLKLELFRGYIREWLPVFLTRPRGGRRNFTTVCILDFFAGPGRDASGDPGSPVIIVDELKRFCRERHRLKAEGVDVRLVFNDANESYIQRLRKEVSRVACPEKCCQAEFSSLAFQDALRECMPMIRRGDTASLVIMDQCGVKEVPPDIVGQLAECGTTDVLFFISSSAIRRFIDTPELGGKLDMEPEEVKSQEYNYIHRYVCGHYREKLEGHDYHLAPFSIKKGSNIYGVIFGSGSLLGLQKFLRVCWAEDRVTGEANYNIDGDFSWAGQRSLFAEQNVIRKADVFEHDLRDFVAGSSPDNRDVYRFCLTRGFLPMHARTALRAMQEASQLTVAEIETGSPVKRGAFYLTWENYNRKLPRVRFIAGSG